MEVSNVASKRSSDDEITILNHSSLFLNGRITNNRSLIKPLLKPIGLVKNKKVYADPSSNHWSSSENNSNNSWVVGFRDGEFKGYNKSDSRVVRPCVAF